MQTLLYYQLLPQPLLLFLLLFSTGTVNSQAGRPSKGIQIPSPFRLIEKDYTSLLDKLSEDHGLPTYSLLETLDYIRSDNDGSRKVLSTSGRPSYSVSENISDINDGFGFAGNSSSSGTEDQYSQRWEPRGITTGEDRLNAEVYNKELDSPSNRNADETRLDDTIIVSWIDASNRSGELPAGDTVHGARISLIDAPDREEEGNEKGQKRIYANVLLVEPFEDGDDGVNFRQLKGIDSAGIVWHGKWLYVSDSSPGTKTPLRIFDLTRFYEVEMGNTIGRTKGKNGRGDTYRAFNHGFVLVQTKSYSLSLPDDISMKFDYIALDRNSTQDGTISLLAGESVAEGTLWLVKWKIDLESSLPLITDETDSNPPAKVSTAEWAYGIQVMYMTGFAFRGKYWFMASRGDKDQFGNLNAWRPLTFSESVFVFPEYIWGISYKKRGDQILALSTEVGEKRGIFPCNAAELFRTWAARNPHLEIDQRDDGLNFTPTDTQPPPTSTGGDDSTNTGQTQPSETNNPPASSSSSPGKAAIVGASFGSIFGVIALLLIAGLIFRQKKKRRLLQEQQNEANGVQYPPGSGDGNGSGSIPTYKPELGDTPIHMIGSNGNGLGDGYGYGGDYSRNSPRYRAELMGDHGGAELEEKTHYIDPPSTPHSPQYYLPPPPPPPPPPGRAM